MDLTLPQNRTQEAFTQLARLAEELGPEARLPSFLELRERLHVSVVTLNKALEQLEARRIVERKHGVGIFVSSHLGRKTVSLLINPRFASRPGEFAEESPVWGMLQDAVRRRVTDHGQEFSMHFLADEGADAPFYEDFARSVREKRVHGAVGIGMTAAALRFFATNNLPVVTFAGSGTYRVETDGAALVRLGTEELAAHRCRRIGLVISGHATGIPDDFWRGNFAPASDYETGDVLADFAHALTKANLPLAPERVCDGRSVSPLHARSLWQQGYQHAHRLWRDTAERPDGIVSTNDIVTQGMIVAFGEMGVAVGADIKIASHANAGSPALEPWLDRVTTLAVSPDGIVAELLRMLNRLMAGETVEPAHVWHTPALVRPRPAEISEELGVFTGARLMEGEILFK